MAKKKRKKRSAIVPAMVLSAGLLTGAAVVPMLTGCGGGNKFTVGAQCFDVTGTCFSVAADGFAVADVGFRPDLSGQFSVADIGFTVAAQGFDLGDDAKGG